MKSFSLTQLTQIALISIIISSLFIGATYLHAEWSNPPSSPPSGNVAAPVNTSAAGQIKSGQLGVVGLIAANVVRSGQNVIADNQMRSNQYCDRNGNNCFSPNAEIGSGGDDATCPSRSFGSGECSYTVPNGDAMEVRFSYGDHSRCDGFAVTQCRDGAWRQLHNELIFDSPDGSF